ncbi:MAG: RNA-binding S4 domain-containing protein [Hyphomonadaceae bacterium]|nr:RNA-binding S4 domain-containing protein [Hyphomonadaceae bacterium]
MNGQRIDVWLYRARLVKTRAAAAALVTAGRVRLVRDGASRSLSKPSAELKPGDGLVLSAPGGLVALEVVGLPRRRGPPSEARALYSERAAEALA